MKRRSTRLVLVLVGIASLAAGLLVSGGEGEAGFWWSHIYGFFALLGFGGCAAIVLIAKWLGRWLMREEDHYE